MEANTASKTALLIAGYRAAHSAKSERMFNDPWAGALAGDDGADVCRRLAAIQPDAELWVAVRTAFLDDRIRGHTVAPPHLKQVVLLGAGYDTRAARLALPGVRYFEVDHPASQAEKLERLKKLDDYPLDAATYASCDFERDDFLERLGTCGFDATQPAVLLWEGVTHYLSEESVRSNLRRMATGCHPQTVLIFDGLGKKFIQQSSPRDQDNEAAKLLAELGEPTRWGTDNVLPYVYEAGFRHAIATSFDEAALNFTGTYERKRGWRHNFMVVASVETPVWGGRFSG